jgi:hypothetical protein
VRRHERQTPGSGTERGKRRHADKSPSEAAAPRRPRGISRPVGKTEFVRFELLAGLAGSPNLLRCGFGRVFIPGGASVTNANH